MKKRVEKKVKKKEEKIVITKGGDVEYVYIDFEERNKMIKELLDFELKMEKRFKGRWV